MKKLFCYGLALWLLLLGHLYLQGGSEPEDLNGFTLDQVFYDSWNNYIDIELSEYGWQIEHSAYVEFQERWEGHITEVNTIYTHLQTLPYIAHIGQYSTVLPSEISEDTLIITHSSFNWTGFSAAWVGINNMSDIYRSWGKKIVLLAHADGESPLHSYFPKFDSWTNRRPDYLYVSGNGSNNINFQGSDITIIGGQFNQCHIRSIKSIVENHSTGDELNIHLPMDAIACEDSTSLEDHYIVRSLSSFLGWFNGQLILGGPILNGQSNNHAVITYIYDTEVQRRGGDPNEPGVKRINLKLNVSLPSINITYPGGGERFYPGDKVNITWENTGRIEDVHIYLHSYGTWYQDIIRNAENNGSFEWTVPEGLVPNCHYTIEVRSSGSPIVWDISNEFCLENTEPRSITLTSPQGGDTLKPGDRMNVNWTSTGNISQVHIYLHSYGTWCRDIIRNAENSGSFEWTVPEGLVPHCHYTVEVRSVDSPIVWDITYPFCINNGYPDLYLKSITVVPGTPIQGQTCTFYFSVQNIGDTLNPATTINCVLTTSGGAFVDEFTVNCPVLNPWIDYTPPLEFGYTMAVSGDLQLDAVIDPGNDIVESNEGNNDKRISFTVNPVEKEKK